MFDIHQHFTRLWDGQRVFGGKAADEKNKTQTRMKLIKHINLKVRSRLPSILLAAAFLTLNAMPAFAQAFNSTELKSGISNSLAVIMMFGFSSASPPSSTADSRSGTATWTRAK